jgi:hypothetical protein
VTWRGANRKGPSRISPLLASLAITAGGIAVALPTSTANAATKPSCATVSVATLDKVLALNAESVLSTYRSSPSGPLICSYFGLSGTRNEATIIYTHTNARTFHAVEKLLAHKHAVSNVKGVQLAAYDYKVDKDYYLFVFDDGYQVELYAAVTVARMERLASQLPKTL